MVKIYIYIFFFYCYNFIMKGVIKLFRIIPEQAERIKRKYKLVNIAEKVGISTTLMTFIFQGVRNCSEDVAYCITKYVDSEAEIENFFVRTNKGE